MERILIIGSNGAGKSTFSYRLADKTGLPLIHLDQLYWYGSWQVRPHEEFKDLVRQEARKSRWIIEGNNVRSLEERLDHADTLFWFEFPPARCIWNILKREFKYRGKARPDMPEGCISILSLNFLRSAWNFNKTNRAKILALLARYPHVTVVRFTSHRQVRSYLDGI